MPIPATFRLCFQPYLRKVIAIAPGKAIDFLLVKLERSM
jgi:hypothetical protein